MDADVTVDLGDFLGARALEVIDEIEDPALHLRIIAALGACAETLQLLDHFDLSQYELLDPDVLPVEVWERAAPNVREVLLKLHAGIDVLLKTFPAPVQPLPNDFDLDAAFAEPTNERSVAPARHARALAIDALVEGSTAATSDQLGATLYSLASMLARELTEFGKRLRSPQVMTDRWFLLSELQELRGKATKCLEAIAAAIVTTFSNERLELVLPRYVSEALRASALRAAIADLHYEMKRWNSALDTADVDTSKQVRAAIIAALDRLARDPVDSYMRAQDKRHFIEFRWQLRMWPETSSLTSLRQAVEGFTKFLEVMRGINARIELRTHDKRHLLAAWTLMAEKQPVERALPHLQQAYGRDERLDEWLRTFRRGEIVPRQELVMALESALNVVMQ